MIFGFNTEVKIGNTVYHVQTEDHGGNKHLIETTVYMGGRLIHRRKNSYDELLDSPNFSDAALRQRLEEQHKGVIDELRGGQLTFDAPAGKAAGKSAASVAPKPAAPPAPAPSATPPMSPPPAAKPAQPAPDPAPVPEARQALVTPPPAGSEAQAQLLNPASWYAQGTATLRIDVKSKINNTPLADAMLLVVIQSPQGPITFAAKSDSKGRVELVFPLPRMGPSGAEIAIRVPGEDEIKYSLKPTTG